MGLPCLSFLHEDSLTTGLFKGERRGDEGAEEGMGFCGTGFEFRVELTA